ncbi:uncharacterized protein N7529_012168 [Penicillium soppii]|uniref:uncharacterized protein n=1 Tax=Penicillium soppii TaxID=69789 RepID=UPI00254792C9|nr:uncharacterized protein N7529_012168 [Penicillium soppii]KAJ5852783.1 hypothetical protein N7529_012168 [Penicillium soppii]
MSPKRTESGNMLPRYGAKSKIRGRVLNEDEMTFLRDKPYIYNAFNDSFLELLFLQQFWTYITDLIPQWVAPCVLTGYGLAINITTCLILLHYSVGNTEETPSWTFVLAAIGVFVYQTLDGIDGKVAIRVQNTPIEEVYDHGCDAVSAVFITLAAAVTLQLYSYPVLTLLCLLMSSIAFFSTHWLCHVKHQMIFGRVDIAESQFFIIAIHIVTACFGQSLWHAHLATIWAFRLRIVHVIAFGTVVGLLLATFKNVNLAVLGAKTPLEEMGIHIPVRQAPMIWSSLVPMTTITLLAVWAFKFGYLVASPTAFYISFGLAYAKVTIVLLVSLW